MGDVERDQAGLEILDDATCDRLLRDQAIGRIGIVIDGDPLILPVNYAWVDGVVLVRSGAGSKLTAAAREARASFQIDGMDPIYHGGWSVLVVGTLNEVADPANDPVASKARLRPWARGGGPRDHWLRLTPDRVTGRRIG